MKADHNVHVFTPDTLAKNTADFIVKIARESVAANGRFSLSLSGGKTPEQLYSTLAAAPYREQMPWKNTYIFWGDERCVPADDDQNNARMADKYLLSHVDIPQANIFRVPVNLAPEKAAVAYEQAIKQFFADKAPCFDLILLGLGENGHTASLFPGTSVLTEHTHLVKEVYVPEQKMYRITMTADLINKAKNIIFLVAGAGKAAILNDILTHVSEPAQLPAQLIKPEHGKLYWFVDNKASMSLT